MLRFLRHVLARKQNNCQKRGTTRICYFMFPCFCSLGLFRCGPSKNATMASVVFLHFIFLIACFFILPCTLFGSSKKSGRHRFQDVSEQEFSHRGYVGYAQFSLMTGQWHHGQRQEVLPQHLARSVDKILLIHP